MSQHKLVDQHGRHITHLRLSLTKKCDFKCLYCMPPEGVSPYSNADNLTHADIERLVNIFKTLGTKKIRLTGGEPLVRKDIVDIVQAISRIIGGNELAMTTNGHNLYDLAQPLKKAGLDRINISLDSLDANNFFKITHVDAFHKVWSGIQKALELNFPIKINAVIMHNINHHEIDDFINLAFTYPVEEIRFIEFMPLCGSGWKPELVHSLSAVKNEVMQKYQATPIYNNGSHVAESCLIKKQGKTAKVGFIQSVSNPFCNTCSRIRITADGDLRPCLFSHKSLSLKKLLENGATDHVIQLCVQDFLWHKKAGSHFMQTKTMLNFKNTKQHFEGINVPQTEMPFIRDIGG